MNRYVLVSILLCRFLTCYSHSDHTDEHAQDISKDQYHAQISDHRFFLQEIFTKYGHKGKMTFEGFEHLLESLGLGNIIITDHDVSAHQEDDFQTLHHTHDHPKKETEGEHGHESSRDMERNSADSHQNTVPTKGTDKVQKTTKQAIRFTTTSTMQNRLVESNSILPTDNKTKPDIRTSSQTAQPSTRYLTPNTVADNIYHYRLPDTEIPELLVNISSLVDQHQEMVDESQEIVIEQCLSPREILETFGINQSTSLNPVSFLHLCPAIIYELDQGHCLFRNLSHKKNNNLPTPYQWLYTLLAVLVISLCGLLSVAVIPIMQKWFYHTLLQFFVGLAVGSLSGDALLHLMPHAMLGGHSGPFIPEVAEKSAVWRGFAALGGVLFFFIAERLLAIVTSRQKKAPRDSEIVQDPVFYSEGKVGQKLSQYRKNSNLELTEKEMMHMLSHTSVMSSSTEVPELRGHSHGHSHDVPQSVSAVAWMVIMGDGLHNFCDGLAIGAAFASGIEGGISTTVAVFCHELPHELGDFAMLLQTGMAARRALLYNVLSSALCLAGAAMGLFLGGVTSATGWIFSVTAGIFLYVALVDMLPELSASKDQSSSPLHQLGIQVLGICTGISIMLVIANYEQEIQSLIS